MPNSLIINNDTGLAESMPEEQARVALTSGTHSIPMNDPQGNPVTAPFDQATSLMSQGYTQPSTDQLANLNMVSQRSAPLEQAKSAVEGALSTATLGASTAAEVGSGITTPEAIRERREVNPGINALGQVAGIPLGAAATALIPGVGEAGLLAKAGESVAGLTGLADSAAISAKIGSQAVKAATENAIISGSDEASKMFSSDPNQSAESAIVNTGLGALMGGAVGAGIGVASPLWSAAKETKLGNFLDAITAKANGVGMQDTLPSPAIKKAADNLGVKLPDAMNAGLSENPAGQSMYQHVAQSNSNAGSELRQTENIFRSDVNRSIINAVGKTPEDVDALSDMSMADIGNNVKDSLKNEIKTQIDPLTQQFEDIKTKYAQAPLNSTDISKLSDQLAQYSQAQGYQLLKGSPQGSLVQKVMDSLPNVKTLEDLRKITSSVGELSQSPDMWGVGKGLKQIFRSNEEDILGAHLGEEAPELLQAHQQARGAYQGAMGTIDSLNDRLHVGNYAGPGSFLKALDDMKPEDVLRRMTPKNDSELLGMLGEKFPQTAQAVKDSYLNQALTVATKNPVPGESINPNNLFKALGNWSPELRQFALPEGAEGKLTDAESLLSQIPKNMNPSGTAKTIDSLWSKMSGGAMSMVSMLTGHSPVAGWLLGQLGRYVGSDIPDALKLATLKFLGSSSPVSSQGFRALAEVATHSAKGIQITNQAIGKLLKAGTQVLPQSIEPSKKDLEKLHGMVETANSNPETLFNVGGHTGHYADAHASSFGATSGRAVQYLQSIKPQTPQMGAFGPKAVPPLTDILKYKNALEIAEQPLMSIKKMSQGTLTPEDVQTVQAIYPNWYRGASQSIMSAAMDHVSKGKTIPYGMKMQMSLFTGQPLDNTMTQASLFQIQGAQQIAQAPQAQQSKPSKKGMQSFAKGIAMAMTPSQSRETTRQANV